MGGDGGVFAVNRKFFAACRNTSKDGHADNQESAERQLKLRKRYVKCRTCAISNEALVEPIVACRLGFLYSKENLIKSLLNKSLHSNFSHIKSLKHVKNVILTPNPDFSSDSIIGGGDGDIGKDESELPSPYMCPVTQLPLNGVYNFVLIWTTGHVLSEKAIREIGVDGLQVEYGPFSDEDIVGLLPAEDDLNTRRAKLEAEAEIAKRKAKHEKKRAREKCDISSEGEHQFERRQPKSSKKESSDLISLQSSFPTSSKSKIGTGAIVDEAKSSVAQTKAKSELYDNLFHKEKTTAQKSGDNLFFSVAGIRYTL